MALGRRTQNKRDGSAKTLRVAVEIILIDQAPLRRTVAADCTAAMARLERARVGWHRFEREDKPAFARWRAREFGALLSQAREVEDQIRSAHALIHEVEMEMRRHIQNPQTAYQRVMYRRENPGVAGDEPDQSPVDPSGTPRKLSEFEKEALFQEWVQKFLGTNPDKMDDHAYSTSFEVFKSHMFVSPREEPRQRNPKRRGAKEKVARESHDDHEQGHAQGRGIEVDARVKELYRTIVRRLHPDLRADGSATVSALWHEVQEAYAASDVARMEILLALSDIESNEMGEGTSLSQMRSVLLELNRSSRALEKSVLEAEGEDAWNFARMGATDDLKIRVERQLKLDLAARSTRLDLLTRTIEGWARGPVANPKVRQVRSVSQARP